MYEGVDRALVSEWQRSWDTATTGKQLYEVLSRVGEGWSPGDAEVASRVNITMVVTGHFHLGGWSPPRDPDIFDECPLLRGSVFSESCIVGV